MTLSQRTGEPELERWVYEHELYSHMAEFAWARDICVWMYVCVCVQLLWLFQRYRITRNENLAQEHTMESTEAYSANTTDDATSVCIRDRADDEPVVVINRDLTK